MTKAANPLNSFAEHIAFDETLAVGQTVFVRWGYGSGFEAEGEGEITKVYAKSVRVRLTEDVFLGLRERAKKPSWPKGFELKGIPRMGSAQWSWWGCGAVRHGVEPSHAQNEEV